MLALSTTLRNSRTFPGQVCCCSSSIASGLNSTLCGQNLARKLSARGQNEPTEFELQAQKLHLTERTYASSAQLRTWCEKTATAVTFRNGYSLHGTCRRQV